MSASSPAASSGLVSSSSYFSASLKNFIAMAFALETETMIFNRLDAWDHMNFISRISY